jgi:hypothetical protein
MARGKIGGRLQAVAIRALLAAGKPGAKADGGNLYLRIVGPGSAKWTLRYMVAAAGDLSPEEGQAVAAILEMQRRAIETLELENRITELEARQNNGGYR